MADIINTPRGPKFYKSGTVRGLFFVLPVMPELRMTLSNIWLRPRYECEYYVRSFETGEWDWTHTETSHHQKYPDPPPPPEHPLPEGV